MQQARGSTQPGRSRYRNSLSHLRKWAEAYLSPPRLRSSPSLSRWYRLRPDVGEWLGEQHEVVFADALNDEEDRRHIACVYDAMRPQRRDCVTVPGRQNDLIVWSAHKNAQRAFEHINQVLHLRVEMPRHLLSG